MSELRPPGKLQTLLEARTPFHIPFLFLKALSLSSAPKGDGKAVVLLPGYLTDKYAMYPLKSYLTYLGYKVFDWGQGRNMGQVEYLVDSEIAHLLHLQKQTGIESFTLIGWSLGGVISREIARLLPGIVAEVITMGAPITGGPKYTTPGKHFIKQQNINIDELDAKILRHNQLGLKQAVASIYSKSDGIVAWEASLGIYNKHAKNIEVSSTHMGIGINAEVWSTIACLLAKSDISRFR